MLNTAVYIVLGVDVDGGRDVLGHWVGDGAEGANFWLSVVSDLQARGVEEIFIACIDGLSGFKEAIRTVFPQVEIQRCIIHQIRQSLNYVSWKDRKAFVADLKGIYGAATREAAELELLQLGDRWGGQYATAVRSWERNWTDLATMFDYPAEIRRLIYTTNTVEGYNRQVRKVTKTKGALPGADAARKLLYLATREITRTWSTPIFNWAKIRNQRECRIDGVNGKSTASYYIIATANAVLKGQSHAPQISTTNHRNNAVGGAHTTGTRLRQERRRLFR